MKIDDGLPQPHCHLYPQPYSHLYLNPNLIFILIFILNSNLIYILIFIFMFILNFIFIFILIIILIFILFFSFIFIFIFIIILIFILLPIFIIILCVLDTGMPLCLPPYLSPRYYISYYRKKIIVILIPYPYSHSIRWPAAVIDNHFIRCLVYNYFNR